MIAIKTHPGVIQVLEVVGRDLGGGLAEGALEPPSTVDELHERRHVGFAPDAADRSGGSEIRHRWFGFAFGDLGHRGQDERERHSGLLPQLLGGRDGVHRRSVIEVI